MFSPRFAFALFFLILSLAAAAPTYKHSWVQIAAPDPGPYTTGDTIEVTVHYHLDADDAAAGETRLAVQPLGPRGAPGTTPVHRPYPGMTTQTVKIGPGSGSHTFRFPLQALFNRNDLKFSAYLQVNGRRWPLIWSYDSRTDEPLMPSLRIEPRLPFYVLETDRPANLFTYEEPVRVRIVFRDGATAGEQRELHYRLFDADGNETAGALAFTVGDPGAHTEVVLPVERRGIFALEAAVEGWGQRELVFGRIPDVRALTNDGPTPFGGSEIQTETENRIARLLGLTFTRHHNFNWARVQPEPDRWDFDVWDRILETNRRHGLEALITVWNPPLWIMPDGVFGERYQPFPFDHDAWRDTARTIAARWADRLHGLEWLNEITPGTQTTDPVGDYLTFARIGTEAVREVAPDLKIQLAGGLWPRNFRQDVLRAGIAGHIDIFPVHYGDESAVLDARDDLAAAGQPAGLGERVALWDNETARPLWVDDAAAWRDIIRDRTQPEWVLGRWPGELVAGAERIIYFGGFRTLAAGGWNYLIDHDKPLPVAITLAVQSAKLGLARPVGRIPLGELGVAYLFENAGRPVAVVSTRHTGGETVTLDIAGPDALLTDYQGNETRVPAPRGQLTLALKTLPVFVEGGSLDAWRSHASLRIGDGRGQPRFVRPRGSPLHVPVEVVNPFDRTLKLRLALRAPEGWPAPTAIPVAVPAGETRRVRLTLPIPADASVERVALEVVATFPDTAFVVRQKGVLDVIDPSMIGNLLRNPGFEQPGTVDERAEHWGADPEARRTPTPPDDATPGLGRHVFTLDQVEGKWGHVSQAIPVLAGQSYLYSVWVRTDDIKAGSNVTIRMRDGTSRTLTINRVFIAPLTSPWRVEHMRVDLPPGAESISVTPTATGVGVVSYDNASVTLYEGTAFAATASRVVRAPKIDGRLDDWNLDHPIPLLADNQLATLAGDYRWVPENLSGAGWLQWDASGLYLAARVRDDHHETFADEARLSEGDSLVVAIHPGNRAAGEDHRAFAYTVSAARPGAGGGAHTLYRDSRYAGGLSSGHLARDSSVYKLAVRRDEAAGITDYELFMPWSELGGIAPEVGAKFGLSLQLNDSDGAGRAAVMSFGEGLHPHWEPMRFGVATLLGQD